MSVDDDLIQELVEKLRDKEHWAMTLYKTLAVGFILMLVGFCAYVLKDIKVDMAVSNSLQIQQSKDHDAYVVKSDLKFRDIAREFKDHNGRIIRLEVNAGFE